MNSALSQEEINALLNNNDNLDVFGEIEKDAIGEIANISMGSAATALYGLLNRRVEITTPRVKVSTVKELVDSYNRPCVVVDVQYVEGLKGNNQLILNEEDTAIITDLMMGGDGTAPPKNLTDLHMSAVGEAMNQMMGSASTSMSDFFEGDKVNISPPKAELLELDRDRLNLGDITEDSLIVQVIFDMHIGDLIDSQIIQVMTMDFAKNLSKIIMSGIEGGEQSEPKEQIEVEKSINNNSNQRQEDNPPQSSLSRNMDYQVQEVEFNELGQSGGVGLNNDIRLIQDVTLELTVRLGKTRMPIKDILDLGPGSVIELDRLAGEAVDLLVNGKLIAKGEVVVIDENFGFRVTDIVSSAERINEL